MKDNIHFGEKAYYIDVDAIMNWCLFSSSAPVKETEINEGYDTNDGGDMQMMTKVVRELKTTNSQDSTIRYDFIKSIITPFLGDITEPEEVASSFSNALLFNTLINSGFLKEKK